VRNILLNSRPTRRQEHGDRNSTNLQILLVLQILISRYENFKALKFGSCNNLPILQQTPAALMRSFNDVSPEGNRNTLVKEDLQAATLRAAYSSTSSTCCRVTPGNHSKCRPHARHPHDSEKAKRLALGCRGKPTPRFVPQGGVQPLSSQTNRAWRDFKSVNRPFKRTLPNVSGRRDGSPCRMLQIMYRCNVQHAPSARPPGYTQRRPQSYTLRVGLVFHWPGRMRTLRNCG